MNKINAPCSSSVGFSDDNSEWLTPAKRKRKIDLSERDEDSDSQWEEDDADEVQDREEGDKERLAADDDDDDDDDMVDDYGAMEDSSEGEEGDQEEGEAGSDGEEVCNEISKPKNCATLKFVFQGGFKHKNPLLHTGCTSCTWLVATV